MTKKWFTLVETVIVVAILAILLSGTVFLWYNYMLGLQIKHEKERFLSWVEYTLGVVRTTNYYGGAKYTYLDLQMSVDGMDWSFDTGSGFENIQLKKSQLAFSWLWPTIRLTPYARPCTYLDDINATGFTFTLNSNINDDMYCFDRDLSVCKLFLVTCP